MLQTCYTSESNQTEIEDPCRHGIRHDMTVMPATNESHKTVCILNSANCGVGLRSEGREITCLRGNKSRLTSLGYTCEKALRLNHHQNGMKRLPLPMMRSTTTRSLAPRWKKEPSVSPWLTRKRLRRSVAHILIIDESVSALWRCASWSPLRRISTLSGFSDSSTGHNAPTGASAGRYHVLQHVRLDVPSTAR